MIALAAPDTPCELGAPLGRGHYFFNDGHGLLRRKTLIKTLGKALAALNALFNGESPDKFPFFKMFQHDPPLFSTIPLTMK
jgi:hypothetical protein